MGPSARLFSKPNEFLETLARELAEGKPNVARLERETAAVFSDHDYTVVQRYFLLYTVPLLEAGGLLEAATPDDALFWSLNQTRLWILIRYLDDIVDGDTPSAKCAGVLLASHHLLTDLKSSLRESNLLWGREQDDIYGQFYAFEQENRAGYRHDFDSLWRRVSPLCVLSETLLADRLGQARLAAYRDHLAWSLLQADCDDGLKDLRKGSTTPVTRALDTALFGVHRDWEAGAKTVASIRAYLGRRRKELEESISGLPLWRTVIRHLEEAFAHAEQPV